MLMPLLLLLPAQPCSQLGSTRSLQILHAGILLNKKRALAHECIPGTINTKTRCDQRGDQGNSGWEILAPGLRQQALAGAGAAPGFEWTGINRLYARSFFWLTNPLQHLRIPASPPRTGPRTRAR